MHRYIPCLALIAATAPLFGQVNVPVNISGLVTDSAGAPLAAAVVKLENTGYTATSGQDGRFTLTSTTALRGSEASAPFASLHDGALALSLPVRSDVLVTVYGISGEEIATLERIVDAGSHSLRLPDLGSGVRFLKVAAGGKVAWVKGFALEGVLRTAPAGVREAAIPAASALAKGAAAAALYDVLTVTKVGYHKGYVTITKSDTANVKVAMLKATSPKFSFFVTSMRTLQKLAGEKGFGGDFRFGETGPGAGLRGADKICATIAEKSLPGSGVKGWRAFLSVTADANGKQVDAIDRVGPGPWYDRIGRLVAPTKADLVDVRPKNGDPTIQLDLPNEFGIPNRQPDPALPPENNHHMVTGSNAEGKLYSQTATCKDWTTSVHSAENGKPICGFAYPRTGVAARLGINWMSSFEAPGCAAGVEIVEMGKPTPESIQGGWIGGGGGYGGFYCFALNP